MSMDAGFVILSTAEVFDAEWARAFRAAGEAAGLTVAGPLTPGAAAPLDQGGLVLTTDPAHAGSQDPGRIFVLDEGLPADTLAASDNLAYKSVIRAASVRLAAASELILRGAGRVDGAAAGVRIEGLGEILRATPGSAPKPSTSPLALFSTLPPGLGTSVTWRPDVFSYPVNGGYDGGPSQIDLTGRGRIIQHGPYIELTPGVWRATAQVSVRPERGIAHLRFEWGVGTETVASYIPFDRPGRYAVSIERVWTERAPSQFIVWTHQPLFQGHFEFHDCVVERVGEAPPMELTVQPQALEGPPAA